MKQQTPAQQLKAFLSKYSPEIRATARFVLTRLRLQVPPAVELVYDNYNGLVIGLGPSERASEAIFSIVLYPRWVSLFFLRGATLRDPAGLLKGSGHQVRHIVLERASVVDEPGPRRLIAQALKTSHARMMDVGRRRLVIKSVSVKQRPRRPGK
jgi:hypothetical protein